MPRPFCALRFVGFCCYFVQAARSEIQVVEQPDVQYGDSSTSLGMTEKGRMLNLFIKTTLRSGIKRSYKINLSARTKKRYR